VKRFLPILLLLPLLASGNTFTASSPATNAVGMITFTVTSDCNGPSPVSLRLLPAVGPTNLEHRFIIVLPVEQDPETTYGNGMQAFIDLKAQSNYYCTVAEMQFQTQSNLPGLNLSSFFGADSDINPNVRYETLLTTLLVPWLRTNFSKTGSEPMCIIGYSRSGLGAFSLMCRNPSVFDKMAIYQSPLTMTNWDTYDSSENFSTAANWKANYRLTDSFLDAHVAGLLDSQRIYLCLSTGYFCFDMHYMDAALTARGVPHYVDDPNSLTTYTHNWQSGWVTNALPWLALPRLNTGPGRAGPMTVGSVRVLGSVSVANPSWSWQNLTATNGATNGALDADFMIWEKATFSAPGQVAGLRVFVYSNVQPQTLKMDLYDSGGAFLRETAEMYCPAGLNFWVTGMMASAVSVQAGDYFAALRVGNGQTVFSYQTNGYTFFAGGVSYDSSPPALLPSPTVTSNTFCMGVFSTVFATNYGTPGGGFDTNWVDAAEPAGALNGGFQANYLIWQPITLSSGGTCTNLRVYAYSSSVGTVKIGLYSGAGSLLKDAGEITSKVGTLYWQEAGITSQSVSAGTYYVAMLTGDSTYINTSFQSGGTSSYATGIPYAGGLPATLPAGTTQAYTFCWGMNVKP